MNGWILACLAVMALALVAMAAGQVMLALVATRVARQTTEAVQEFRRDIRPIVERVQKIAEDTSTAAALAAVQAERIDQIIEMTAQRIDETLTAVQKTVLRPLRQGAAVVAGLRAALAVFRSVSDRRTRHRARDEEDALFIG